MTTTPAAPPDPSHESVSHPVAETPAEAEHRLASRRRRRSRRRRHRHMMSAAVIGLLVGATGAALGVAGAVGLVGGQDQRAEREAEARREAEFVGLCEARLRGIDCGCLWNDARPAFLDDTRDAVLSLIAERESLPLRVQRIRTERLVGPELAKTVWAAAYYCVNQ